MPKPNEYTPARRVAMQIALWGILVASVGVAAIVDTSLGAKPFGLGAEQHVGLLHFQLPAGWEAVMGSEDDVRVIATAEEPAEPHRMLRVYSQKMRRVYTPADYLREAGLNDEISFSGRTQITTTTMGGAPAIFVRGQRLINARNADGLLVEAELVVCAVYPNQTGGATAITLWLDKPGIAKGPDQQLLKQIAASVKLDTPGN